jgi:peptide/nickel transport system substrate-binding protein
MSRAASRRRACAWRFGLVGLAATVVCAGASARSAPPTDRCLVAVSAGDTPFARNFNPFANPVDFTWGGIYEPLVVVTAGGRRRYNWLASRLVWSRDRKTLTVTVRSGVRWSDGRPLTAEDVVYTLTAGRQDKAMDQIGLLRPGNNVAWIGNAGPNEVAIRLERRDSTFVSEVLANNLRVVPKHVFANVRHISTWMNATPVGSGPFALVGRFNEQAYVLRRNPDYWLKGAPHIPCVERLMTSSGASALMQLVKGDADVSNQFFPNVRKAYVSHDREHYHFFYPAAFVPIGLYLDDTRYPFSLVDFRRAVSMAIDREQITRLAEYGYAAPVDAIGINRVWPGWMDRSSAKAARKLAAYDPAEARRTLLAAGFTYEGDTLVDPKGQRVVIEAKVAADWTDWVTAWRIIARNLKDIGIGVDIQFARTWGDWQRDAFATKFATMLWSIGEGSTPYGYYRSNLDRAAFVPSGKDAAATGNWEHFASAEGTRLLSAFRRTFDVHAQHRLANKLAQVWLKTLPFVPLFAAPQWSTYSTRHFVGFPNESDFYVEPSWFSSDYVVALTRIRPA